MDWTQDIHLLSFILSWKKSGTILTFINIWKKPNWHFQKLMSVKSRWVCQPAQWWLLKYSTGNTFSSQWIGYFLQSFSLSFNSPFQPIKSSGPLQQRVEDFIFSFAPSIQYHHHHHHHHNLSSSLSSSSSITTTSRQYKEIGSLHQRDLEEDFNPLCSSCLHPILLSTTWNTFKKYNPIHTNIYHIKFLLLSKFHRHWHHPQNSPLQKNHQHQQSRQQHQH